MKRVCILGHFAYGQNAANGQTIKTKIVTEELSRRFGEEQIKTIDTCGGIKTIFKSPFQALSALKSAKNIVMLPAHNGVRVYGFLLPLFRRKKSNKKLFYVVIGGWLPELVKKRRRLAAKLKKFDGIYVETGTMKVALEALGFNNIRVLPNCKELRVLREDELVYTNEAAYSLCTFSRINEKKGIEEAVNAVKAINQKYEKVIYNLDIYGSVDKGQEEWFQSIRETFPSFVQYKGLVDFNKSVDVLKNYFALLFPTRYYTEGVPGTIIDSYASGVPVLSSKWESFSDVVFPDITGYGYEFDDFNDFVSKLDFLCQNAGQVNALKLNCLETAKHYMPQEAMNVLVEDFL